MIGNWNYGTGRRKSSVARVFMKKGTGQILVNGKAGRASTSAARRRSWSCAQPLLLTANDAAFDVKVNVHGGGESGQAGAVRHGITRALIDYDAALKPELEPRRLRDPRRARGRAQEGRPARRPPSQAVQQALILRPCRTEAAFGRLLVFARPFPNCDNLPRTFPWSVA